MQTGGCEFPAAVSVREAYQQLELFEEIDDFGHCPRCEKELTGPGWFHRDPRGPICDRCQAMEWQQSPGYRRQQERLARWVKREA